MNIIRCVLVLLFLVGCATKPKNAYEEKLLQYKKSQPKALKANEIRALWVVRSEIKKRENIHKTIDKMKEYGLNTAIVQVRGLADTTYLSKYEPLADEVEEDLKDPFQYFIDQAKKENIQVQAWVNVNMLSKPKFLEEFSKANQHLVIKKPEWVLKDESSKSMLEYKQEELETDWMDGAYANPAHPEWRKYFLKLVTEIQKKYEIQGIHLDFIRYPNSKHGGKIFGLDEFHLKRLGKSFPYSKEDLLDNPHYIRALDILKIQYMNEFVKEIGETVKKNNPDHLLTAAVWAHRQKTLESVFQDWPFWLKNNYIDHAYMMIYVKDEKVHHKRMIEFFDERYNDRLVIGMGLYRFPRKKVLKAQIDSSRAIGAAGFVFFSGKMLIDPEQEYRLPRKAIKSYISKP